MVEVVEVEHPVPEHPVAVVIEAEHTVEASVEVVEAHMTKAAEEAAVETHTAHTVSNFHHETNSTHTRSGKVTHCQRSNTIR